VGVCLGPGNIYFYFKPKLSSHYSSAGLLLRALDANLSRDATDWGLVSVVFAFRIGRPIRSRILDHCSGLNACGLPGIDFYRTDHREVSHPAWVLVWAVQ
jgi:hypothetical protein